MSAPRCERCRQPLPTLARAHKRYCSTRCRVAAHRAAKRAEQQPPAELTGQRRWVRHSARKVPLTVAGDVASSTDPGTWSTYEEARRSRAGVGLGCVLTGDGIVCIDLDHCLDVDGRPLDWAAELLERIPPTWIEISPGGDGLHIWGRGNVTAGRRRTHGGRSVETYGTGRYITVTGRRYDGAPTTLADLTEVLAHCR